MTIEFKITLKINGKKKDLAKTTKGQTQSQSNKTAIIINQK